VTLEVVVVVGDRGGREVGVAEKWVLRLMLRDGLPVSAFMVTRRS
jgi:hypothetical protein